MQSAPGAFADKSAFFGRETKAMRSPTGSSVCMEIPASLQPVDVPSTSHDAEDSPQCQFESEITPQKVMSIPTTKSKEAEQALFVNEDLTQPILEEAHITQQPTRFSNLDQDVQREIFERVLVRQEAYYRPYYRCGMLAKGPLSAGYIDGVIDCDVVDFENINLSLLQVNKHFNKTCSEIFYGTNIFAFYEADIYRWWSQHIGLKNFSRIRSLVLTLGSGFSPDGDAERGPFDLSQEEIWFNVLHWMKNRHLLQNLYIQIHRWQDLRQESSLTRKERRELHQFRCAISDLLRRFRGIRSVKICSFESKWFSFQDEGYLSLLMQQQRRKAACRKKRREPSLLQLINRIRLERRHEEQEELKQRRRRRLERGY